MLTQPHRVEVGRAVLQSQGAITISENPSHEMFRRVIAGERRLKPHGDSRKRQGRAGCTPGDSLIQAFWRLHLDMAVLSATLLYNVP